MATKNKSEFDKAVDKIEAKAEAFADNVERGVIRWAKNDQFFNGLRNTYARMIITTMTWAGLYLFGAWAFVNPEVVGWYILILITLTVMNQLSVRFAFNVDHQKDLTDEYQVARRDAAYRRAYRKISHQLIAGLLLFYGATLLVDPQIPAFGFPAPGLLEINVVTNLSQIIVVATFYVSLFGLQKYMSWGFKGEPWNDTSRENVNKLKAASK